MSVHEQRRKISPEAVDLRMQAKSGGVEGPEAMSLLRKAAEISPGFYDAHFDFALAALSFCRKNHTRIEQSRLKEIQKEVDQSLDKCIELRPGLAPPYAWKAFVAFLGNEYQLGIEYANKALEIDGDNFGANLNKGSIYLGLAGNELSNKNPGAAREHAKQAIECGSKARVLDLSSFEAVYNLADAYWYSGFASLDLGDKEEGRLALNQALELYKEAAAFSLGQEHYSEQMAYANLKRGQLKDTLLELFGSRYSDHSWRMMQEDIIRYTTTALEYKPDFAQAYRLRALAKMGVRGLHEARADVLRAQELSDDPGLQKFLESIEMSISVKNQVQAKREAARASRQAEQAGARA